MLKASLENYAHFKSFYDFNEVNALREKVKPLLKGDEIYPVKYLFGWHQENGYTKGLLQSYFDKGYDVSLASEPKLKTYDFSSYDAIDVQYASVPTDIVKKLLLGGIKVVGWTPPEFASKPIQAIFVSQRCNKKPFITKQIFLRLENDFKKEWIDSVDSEFVILKGSFGAASHAIDMEYLIAKKEHLPNLLKENKSELIVSELILTDDPFAGNANNVVHKANCISEVNKKFELKFVGNVCQKFVNNGDINSLRRDGILPISKFIVSSYLSKGDLSKIMHVKEFLEAVGFFGFCGCICSVDFMIPIDGVPRFLEMNKLGATFADIFDKNCFSALDLSTDLVDKVNLKIQIKTIEEFEQTFDSIKNEGFLTNPMLISERGVELLI